MKKLILMIVGAVVVCGAAEGFAGSCRISPSPGHYVPPHCPPPCVWPVTPREPVCQPHPHPQPHAHPVVHPVYPPVHRCRITVCPPKPVCPTEPPVCVVKPVCPPPVCRIKVCPPVTPVCPPPVCRIKVCPPVTPVCVVRPVCPPAPTCRISVCLPEPPVCHVQPVEPPTCHCHGVCHCRCTVTPEPVYPQPAEPTSPLPEVETGQEVTIDGRSFGDRPGHVAVSIGDLQLQAEVTGWSGEQVRAILPSLPMTGTTPATVSVLSADGRVADQLSVLLTSGSFRVANR